MICPNVARPHSTVNRIMNRLSRDGFVLPVPRPKDEPYWYMPNPAMVHTESSKLRHYLGLADLFIQLEQPEIYEVEPRVSERYRPDAYTRLTDPVIIEYQRSNVSTRVMQDKVNQFVEHHRMGKHDAKTLWIASDLEWSLKVPEGYKVIQGRNLS